ncbi:DUF4268 domain-containing protein [Tichowtungia aerotolerans]|uniref:DUF4268 domain-containing protein n=1 Tax=Tichowtungia aerotolerans TaxID=2697043 RepID=A0A6P1M9L4_9BACT|nr:DUF4268 domain-containing protein [Tichowtungia aerotolerans]QHI68768.1 DUF4268 domain-containing protein [Tichowtungia aerotolerans]
MKLGRLQKVELRDVWKTEAQHFTPWLAGEENLALLGDTIGLDLELEAVEKDVGPFRADILCKDTGTNAWVLIENQVERTDHTHLGQLLTYAAGLNTVTIVWIAKRFTDEHRAALDWLNEITGDEISFFGLEIELWRIGDSPIAPKFNAVSKPNEWTKGKGGTSTVTQSEKLTPVKQLQLEYWKQFREYVLENSSVMRPQKPAACHWMNFSCGTSKAFPAALLNTQAGLMSVCLQINNTDDRLAVFNLLYQEQPIIESELGEVLEWQGKPDKKNSHIVLRNSDFDPNDKRCWPTAHEWMLEKLEAFRKVFGERIKNMDVGDWQPEDVED